MTTTQDTTPAATRPSGSSGERVMRCSRCDGEWKAPALMPKAPVHCPYCNVHVCGCGCGQDISSRKADSIYAVEAHRKRLLRSGTANFADVTQTRTVAEARAIQEDAKGHWSAIVREGIIEVLTKTGGYHADDLDHLGIPDEHRNIIGSQTAKLVNQKWMVEAGRRKSILPSRNGAKSGIYRLTNLGREKLVGVGADCPKGAGKACTPCLPVSADPGESGSEPSASPDQAPRAGAEEEQQGEGTAGRGVTACAGPAPSTGPLKPPAAPTSSGAGSAGEVLPGLEPTSYERIQDAA